MAAVANSATKNPRLRGIFRLLPAMKMFSQTPLRRHRSQPARHCQSKIPLGCGRGEVYPIWKFPEERMLERAVGNLLLLAVTLAATPAGQAAQYLLVNRTSAGAWSFEEAQSLSVNGKDKLRSGPLGSGTAAAWDSKAIGRLAEVQLSSFRVVRRAPDGSLLARSSDSASWQLLLPEGTNSKTADSAAMLWGASTVTFKKDQKDKSPSAIRLDELYAIVPGPDAP